jgi:predicted nuclease of predicted toxin-antitoxin system
VRFLVDAQLPPALARLIAERGHIAEHVTDIGPGDAPDRDLWRYALARQAVIVTKDEDFADSSATMCATSSRVRSANRGRIGRLRRHWWIVSHSG